MEFVARAIEEQQLLVIPGSVFSGRDTHFRISYAVSDATPWSAASRPCGSWRAGETFATIMPVVLLGGIGSHPIRAFRSDTGGCSSHCGSKHGCGDLLKDVWETTMTLAASRLAQFSQTSPTRVQVISASQLSTLSSTALNEIRFGYSRYRTSFSSLDANYDPSQAGIDFGTGKLGLPEIDFGGLFDNLGATAYSIPRGRTSQSFQLLDNFTWLRGRHTIKFGGEYRRAVIDSFNDNLERGGIVFSTDNGFDPDPGTDILAAYYLGYDYFTEIDAGNTQRTTSNNGLAFFAQDDFRASSKLTVNFGLRWECFGPISESHNLLANLGSDGNLAMVGTDGVSGAYKKDLNNFGPRLGFAWSPRGGTVIRGSYGVYYDYIPQHLITTNFTNDAGLTTPPIGRSRCNP